MFEDASINLDSGLLCNWRCCLVCFHPKESDLIYLNRNYRVRRLDDCFIDWPERIKKTHEKIECYIRYKCESEDDVSLSISRIKSELQVDILKQRNLITYGDLKKIIHIVNSVLGL